MFVRPRMCSEPWIILDHVPALTGTTQTKHLGPGITALFYLLLLQQVGLISVCVMVCVCVCAVCMLLNETTRSRLSDIYMHVHIVSIGSFRCGQYAYFVERCYHEP